VTTAGHDQVERYERLLAVTATREDRLLLLGHLAQARLALGRWREAEESLREAVALAEELADHRALATALVRLGDAEQQQNRHDEADERYRHALDVAAATGGRMTDVEALVLTQRAGCLVETGRRAEAADCLRRVLEIHRAAGDRAEVAATEKLLDALDPVD
jgi:tetratricopeptide (TPR) repeat protein